MPTSTVSNMRIQLKTVCPEILGNIPSRWYEIEDMLSAEEALLACLRDCGTDVEAHVIRKLVFMRNGKHISHETLIQDGDVLMALRPVYGG